MSEAVQERAVPEIQIVLESAIITISCGTNENMVKKNVSALTAGGLAIHPDLSSDDFYAVTHIMTGRKICEVRHELQARLLLAALLRIEINWSQPKLWETQREFNALRKKVESAYLQINTATE